jgi:hypothetical protein
MLSYEQFESSCRKQEKEQEIAQQRAEKFMNYLIESLVNTSMHYFKGLERHRHKFILKLRHSTRFIAIDIYEPLEMFLHGKCGSIDKKTKLSSVPERDVTEHEKQWLEKTLKTVPEYEQAFFIEENNKRLKIERIKREHLFQCHDKIKETLWQHFPEIVDFEANQIRFLDSYSFLCARSYECAFYNLAYDYISEFADKTKP